MIRGFVAAFEAARDTLRARFAAAHPGTYGEIVRAVVAVLDGDEDGDRPDPHRIHEIDDGDRQGVSIFVIAARGYQPRVYYYVRVEYGSCAHCDTLARIESQGYGETPTDVQVRDYMTLALHIVQGIKRIGDND